MKSRSSKLLAISAAQLVCAALVAGQARVNPDAEALARFSDRLNVYLDLQKKVEATLSSQKQTTEPGKIDTHVATLANGIRAQRSSAKAGDIFGSASEQFRKVIREDANERSVRDALAAMQEVPHRSRPRVNDDYPEGAALATVPALMLQRLPRLPDGIEYRFLGRDLILRDTKANLIADVLHEAAPTPGR